MFSRQLIADTNDGSIQYSKTKNLFSRCRANKFYANFDLLSNSKHCFEKISKAGIFEL